MPTDPLPSPGDLTQLGPNEYVVIALVTDPKHGDTRALLQRVGDTLRITLTPPIHIHGHSSLTLGVARVLSALQAIRSADTSTHASGIAALHQMARDELDAATDALDQARTNGEIPR